MNGVLIGIAFGQVIKSRRRAEYTTVAILSFCGSLLSLEATSSPFSTQRTCMRLEDSKETKLADAEEEDTRCKVGLGGRRSGRVV